MTSKVVTLSEFIRNHHFFGKWKISYNDETHLAPDKFDASGRLDTPAKFVDLGEVEFINSEADAGTSLFVPFKFRHYEKERLATSLLEAGITNDNYQKKAVRTILDVLGESVVRCGMIRPRLHLISNNSNVYEDALSHLAKLSHATFITDTSALRRASVSFISTSLPQTSVWTIVPVFVMIEVQIATDTLKSTRQKTNPAVGGEPNPRNYGVLRLRPQVSCISREIQYIKAAQPVEFAQAPPELVRRIKGFSIEDAEKEQEKMNDAINDRLIIEECKNLRRQRSLSQNFFLLTSDSTMGNIASLEGVDAIYIETPPLPKEVASVRFNSFEKAPLRQDNVDRRFVVCPIHYFLWDLVAIFSKIRFTKIDSSEALDLIYYSTQKRNPTQDAIEIKEHQI